MHQIIGDILALLMIVGFLESLGYMTYKLFK